MKLQQLKSGQLILSIPKSIAKLKGWKKEDIIEFEEDKVGNVFIKKVN